MLMTYVNFLRALVKDEEGASAVEYGLILGLIAVAIVGILVIMGGSLKDIFGSASDELSTAAGNAGGGG
jgi:pilus assembly protein Flp/PilA